MCALHVTVSNAAIPDNGAAKVRACLDRDSNAYDLEFAQQTVVLCSDALKSESVTQQKRAEIHQQRGVALMHMGKTVEALPDMIAASEFAPRSAETARLLAWNYRLLGQQEKADAAYDKALELEPHWQAYLSRCVVRIDLKNYAGAAVDCESALKLERNEDSYYFTSWLRLQNGKLKEAIALLDDGMKAPVTSGRIFGLAADALRRDGQHTRSAEVLKLARELFPADPQLSCPPPSLPCHLNLKR